MYISYLIFPSFMFDTLFFLSEFFFILMTLMVLLYGSLLAYTLQVSALKVIPSLLFFSGVLYVVLLVTNASLVNEFCLFNFHLKYDTLSLFFIGVNCILYFIALWMLRRVFYFSNHTFMEPYILLAIFFFGSIIVILSNDFFFFFLALEVVTIVSYILACLKKFSTFATEAALKYFVLGAMSSGLLLFGIVLLYGFTGLTNFVDFKYILMGGFSSIMEGIALVFGLLFVISGLFFKLAIVPFHTWIADVFEGITSPVVFIFSTISKIAVLIVFCKIIWGVFFELFAFTQGVLFFFGLLSVVLGSLAGLVQVNIQRLYAYSAIVNAGYFVVLMSLGSLDGFTFLMNYLVIYVISSIGLFLLLASFRIINDLKAKEFVYFSELGILGRVNPIAALVAALVFFSLAGIPPLAGFFGKFFFLFALFSYGSFYISFIIILAFSIAGTVYYMRCVQMFFFEKSDDYLNCFPLVRLSGVLFSVIFLFLLFFCLYQPSLFYYIQAYVIEIFF